MADPYSNQILNATEEEKKRLQRQGEELATAQERENQAYVAGMEAAQAANQAALDQSQQNYNNLMAKYNNDFAAMVQGESDRIRKEQEEARTMIQADQKAAQWSGLTELASSVANMIGVGSFNAANQQYRSYSQDWMKKADQDLREHRYRMDNIRARQNALRQQQLNLQMGQAGQALAREQQRAERDYANARELAGIRRDANLAPLQTRAQYNDKAAQMGLQGVRDAAGQYNTEAALRQRAFEHTAAMQAKGLNADGTPNEKLMQQHAAAASRATGANKMTGDPYHFKINGVDYTVNLSDRAYDQALLSGTSYLKKDIMKAAGYDGDNWDEFVASVESSGGKKGLFRRKKSGDGKSYDAEIQDVVNAIQNNMRDEEGRIAIDNFIKDHSDIVSNFNTHLAQTARVLGATEEEDGEEGRDSIDDEIFGR